MSRQARDFWRGKSAVVTAGPTREYLDPIRFLTNASSGEMGACLAQTLRHLGARVVLIHGPMSAPVASGIRRICVVSAHQMLQKALVWGQRADAVIGAAAVGDWRFAGRFPRKVKKSRRSLWVRLSPNRDILVELGKRKRIFGRPKILVGFALETERLEKNALRKLRSKGLDWVVANSPASLGGSSIRMTLLSADGRRFRYPALSKRLAASRILSRIAGEAS
ncbi:MAG: phosphopantothenoylcysteine decarboxylase [Elusimicrobia bacterium]|nr:phosphopantothenoylcysteine decarboxylase [Elusimicrobiota bacterium]